jgi:hypothetical protein
MIHAGRFVFQNEAVDVIELKGDGSYEVQLWHRNPTGGNAPTTIVKVEGADAEALREFLDMDLQEIKASHATALHQQKHCEECEHEK